MLRSRHGDAIAKDPFIIGEDVDMNNTQLYPFERNRYYPKKRMSSGDFLAEQAYHNNKRRFLNGLMYGSGVVCGLSVFSLDDLSILIESGVAIDGMGREIVVDSSDVKKLSAVEGFDALKTNLVSLCLRYKEEDVHKVYAIDQSDPNAEFQYNRIREGHEFFLLDRDDVPEIFEMESEFLTRGTLLADEHYLVELVMPAIVSRGRAVKAQLVITKQSDEDVRLTYHGVLQIPAFTASDGRNEIPIDIDNLSLAANESISYDYWMTVQKTPVSETNLILKTGSASAYENERAVASPGNFTVKILLSDTKPRELVTREIGKMNLEMKNIGAQGDFIRLADLRLVRTDSAYIIEEIIETNVKHYLAAPAQEMEREDYLEYFIREGEGYSPAITSSRSYEPVEDHSDGRMQGPEVATGILEIPLGENARKGDTFYSGEIMHGLGKGNVYVEIGYEFIKDDEQIAASAKSTIYGNPDIFANEQRTVVDADTAVRVLNDKGSFIAGARLRKNVDYLVLTYRWVAIRFPAGNDLGLRDDYTGKSISPETPTIKMGTKENHYFGVRFNHMDPVSITYELTESGSGEITSDGIYTAPAKPGVYEIRIYCTDMPVVCTYAYAIVEKKGLEEIEEQGDVKVDMRNPLSGFVR